MIIETSDNRFYCVTEPKDADLAHLYHGFRVKKVRGKWVEAAKAQLTYIRKAATRIVEA
jgi:hypothetical protein